MNIEINNLTVEKIDKKYFQKIGEIVLRKLESSKAEIRTCSLRSQNLVFSRYSKISLAFINNAEMKKWNKIYRGKNKTTDVLSFPNFPQEPLVRLAGKLRTRRSRKATKAGIHLEGILGEIIISIPQAQKQAKQKGYPLKRELSELFIHGILHLAGYDDEKKKDYERMMKKQEEIVKSLI